MPTKRSNGLVPPPPPIMPQFASFGSLAPVQPPQPVKPIQSVQPQGLGLPQLATMAEPQTNVPLPQAPDLSSLLQGPTPADLKGLRESGDLYRKMAGFSADNMVNNPNPYPMASMQQSPFDQFLQQRLQEQILQNMDSNSFGDRFGRGFDMGQQIAASVVIPAMGSFGSGYDAMGANRASQQMQDQVRMSRAQRQASKQAMNSSLVNLAALYENISPSSAKNIAALMKTNLERQKMNQEYKQKGLATFVDMMGNANNATAKLLELQRQAGADKMTATDKEFDNKMTIAKEERAKGAQDSLEQDRRFGRQMEAEKLGISRQNQDLDEQKYATQKEQFATTTGLKKEEMQQTALNQLLTRAAGPMALSSKSLPFGAGQAYPGIIQNYQQDPALSAAFQKLQGAAGIEGNIFQNMQKPGAPAPQPSPQFDAIRWLTGEGMQQPQVDMKQVVANPSQFVKLEPAQQQLLGSATKENAARILAQVFPAIKAQYPQASDAEIAEILNNLSSPAPQKKGK